MKLRNYVPEFIVLIYAIIFLLTKNPTNQWDRVIASDGKGYYAYLPALFIYHDTDFGFIDGYETLYYPASNLLFKDFRFQTGDGIVNKYFPGCSVLWLPFFAGGQFAAVQFGYPTDGYSLPYQWAIALSAFFYFWLALRILRRILRFYISDEKAVGWTLAAIALATNLIYYTVNAGSQVHVYDFFLISAFIYSILAACKWGKTKYVVSAAFMVGMILITRPQDGIVVFAVPFISGSFIRFQKLLKKIFFDWRSLILSIVALALPLSIPVTYWFLKTGHFLIYSYGNEYFNLANPHLFKFLFSFEKGWLLYTPIAAVSLFGLLFLYKNNKWQFFSLSLFLFFLVYFLSSWWAWNYTSFVGQRVMIDYYAFFAILLIYIFLWLKNIKNKSWFPVAISFFIALNLMQFAQHLIWVYPAGPVTAQTYFGNFFSFDKGSTFIIPEKDISEKQGFAYVDGNNNVLFKTENFRVSTTCRSNTNAFLIDSSVNEKQFFVVGIGNYLNISPVILSIRGWYNPSTVDSALLINIKIGNIKEIYSINEHNLMPGLKAGKWKYAEMAMYLPFVRSLSDSLFISFANRSGGNVLFDDINVEFLKLNLSLRFDWILPSEDNVNSVISYFTDLETPVNQPWGNQASIKNSGSFSGLKSSKIEKTSPFSVVFEQKLDDSISNTDGYFRVSSRIFGNKDSKILLVFDFSSQGKMVFYKTYPVAFRPEIDSRNGWTVSEIFRELPTISPKADKIKIYYWYTEGNEPVYIDDLQVDIVKYKPMVLKKPKPDLLIENSKTMASFCSDFESGSPPMSGKIVENQAAFSGKKVCKIDETNLFSFSYFIPLSVLATVENAFVNVTAKVNTDRYKSGAVLVADFRQLGKSVVYLPDYLRDKTKKGCWATIDYLVKIPPNISKSDSVLFYFYMSKSDEVMMIDDFCVKFLVPEKVKTSR